MTASMTSTVFPGRARRPPLPGPVQQNQVPSQAQLSQAIEPSLQPAPCQRHLPVTEFPERRWDGLSYAQKLACINSQESERVQLKGFFNIKYGWPCVEAIKHHWDQIEACIRSILSEEANHERMMKGLHYDEACSSRLLMVSKSLDCRFAEPTIVIGSRRRRIASRACKILKEHQNRQTDYPGFAFMPNKEHIALASAPADHYEPHILAIGTDPSTGERMEMIPSPSKPHTPIIGPSAPAMPVVIAVEPRPSESAWRKATIGGFVKIHNAVFGLTVAHALVNPQQSRCNNVATDASSYSNSDADTSDTTSSDGSLSHFISGSIAHVSEGIIYRVYKSFGPLEQNQHGYKYATSIWPDSLPESRLIGTIASSAGEMGSPEPQIQMDYDWALVRLERFGPEILSCSSTNDCNVPWPNSIATSHPNGQVIVASGQSGFVEALTTGVPCGIRIPGSSVMAEAFTLKCRLSAGDSGSWVIEKSTGKLYGIVIALSEEFGECYCLPATKVFQSIEAAWGNGTKVELLQPGDLVESSKYCSKEEHTSDTATGSEHGSWLSNSTRNSSRVPGHSTPASMSSNHFSEGSSGEIHVSHSTSLGPTLVDSLLQISLASKVMDWMSHMFAAGSEFASTEQSIPIRAFLEWLNGAFVVGVSASSAEPTGESARFVPSRAVHKYFTEHGRLDEIFGALFPQSHDLQLAVDPKAVLEGYTQVFAILLYIGKGNFMPLFTKMGISDSTLPLKSRPYLPQTSSTTLGDSLEDLYSAFEKVQHMFCAPRFVFRQHMVFNEQVILPIVARQLLSSGVTSATYMIEIHKEYNYLNVPEELDDALTSTINSRFLLKTFSTAASNDYFREFEARLHLHDRSHRLAGLTNFYGGFVHGETYNMILECFGGGDLNGFMMENPPPSTAEEIQRFWTAMFELLRGISTLHEFQNSIGKTSIFPGAWHQDIKPDNILISSKAGKSVSECDFVLADLGLSHFKKFGDHIETVLQHESSQDADETQIYGAPELYRANSQNLGTEVVMRAHEMAQADIWSFGCVLSEVATWVVRSYTGVVSYRQRRKEETTEIRGFSATGSFHNGIRTLASVNEQHADLRRNVQQSDKVTGDVLKLIEDMMLPRERRPGARPFFVRAQGILSKAAGHTKFNRVLRSSAAPSLQLQSSNLERNLDHTEASLCGDFSSHPHSRPLTDPGSKSPKTSSTNYISDLQTSQPNIPHSTEKRPDLNISQTISLLSSVDRTEVARRMSAGPSGSSSLALKDASVTNAPYFSIESAMDWYRSWKESGRIPFPDSNLLKQLNGRDHVFLVDDSKSMRAYWGELEAVLELFTYILKGRDADGVDIAFASNGRMYRNCKRAAQAKRLVKEHQPKDTATSLVLELRNLLNKYSSKLGSQRKPTIFKRGLGDVRPLTVYVFTDGLFHETIPGKRLFGDIIEELGNQNSPKSQIAVQFIQFGNDMRGVQLLSHYEKDLDLPRDIIDFEPSTGNIWKMLLGSINVSFDEEHEVAGEVPASENETRPSDGVTSGTWILEEFPTYRLQTQEILAFLKHKFPDVAEANFHIKLGLNDCYSFTIPRKLSNEEREDLRELRDRFDIDSGNEEV